MLYRFCPVCASLRVQVINGSKIYKCNTCGYEGEMKEESVEKINEFRRTIQKKDTEINCGLNSKDSDKEKRDTRRVPFRDSIYTPRSDINILHRKKNASTPISDFNRYGEQQMNYELRRFMNL